jgi:hypothetical protein
VLKCSRLLLSWRPSNVLQTHSTTRPTSIQSPTQVSQLRVSGARSDSASGSQLAPTHAPQAAWQPEQLPTYALASPKPLYGTSHGASQSLYMSGGDAVGVRPSVAVHTTLSGVWKALIVLALMLACVAVGIAAFALTRMGSCSCNLSASSGGGVEAASSSMSSDLLLNATAQRVGILASTVSSLSESITSQRAVLESLSASTTPRFVALAGAVDSLNATIADQQVSLANLSSVTVPHLNWLAGAVDSLNATIADQQAILASLRPTQVVSISPSNLSLCRGGWTTENMIGQNLTLCRKVADSGCGSIFVAVPAGTVYSRVEGWVTLYQRASPDAFGPSAFSTFGDSLTIWSGSTLLWDYAVGFGHGSTNSCPASGGTQPSASLNGFWSCATGTDFPFQTVFNVPLFGLSQAFARNLPAATSAPIELRFCLNEPRVNEEIYLHSASIWVRS